MRESMVFLTSNTDYLINVSDNNPLLVAVAGKVRFYALPQTTQPLPTFREQFLNNEKGPAETGGAVNDLTLTEKFRHRLGAFADQAHWPAQRRFHLATVIDTQRVTNAGVKVIGIHRTFRR